MAVFYCDFHALIYIIIIIVHRCRSDADQSWQGLPRARLPHRQPPGLGTGTGDPGEAL